jgi:BirA family biotin operon repressor/biotin-[acetyl-CoA-carboxylase] ligase
LKSARIKEISLMDKNDNDEIKNRARLFEMLASADGNPLSGSYIACRLGCSRQAVFKLASSLRKEGLNIESSPRKGYALRDLASCDALSPTLIEFLLKDNPVFHKCLYFGETESTQTALKRIAREDGSASGIVAVSDRQSEGRGRVGRTWWSGAGKDLTFSVLTRPKLRPGEVQLLNLAAGIAVSDVLRSYYNTDAEIKWPNDVMVRGRKICGILSEASGEPDRIYFAVTGIGINVNSDTSGFPDELRESAASLAAELGCRVCRPYLMSRVLGRFAELIITMEAAGGRDALLSVYRNSCSTLGRRVRVICDGEEFCGTARDVTDQGALVVDIDGRAAVFAAADVHHLRLAV